MILKDNLEIKNSDIISNFDRITNQIFKLLPLREEHGDWVAPLESLTTEIKGMVNLFDDQKDLFSLICKMEGLKTLDKEEDFLIFRKTIFECLGLLTKVKQWVES